MQGEKGVYTRKKGKLLQVNFSDTPGWFRSGLRSVSPVLHRVSPDRKDTRNEVGPRGLVLYVFLDFGLETGSFTTNLRHVPNC